MNYVFVCVSDVRWSGSSVDESSCHWFVDSRWQPWSHTAFSNASWRAGMGRGGEGGGSQGNFSVWGLFSKDGLAFLGLLQIVDCY